MTQQHHQLVPSFQQWRFLSQASNSVVTIKFILGSEHIVCPRYITPTWSCSVFSHVSLPPLPVPSICFLLHSTPLPGPACFWTSTWHRVYAPFSLPTLASAISEARFLTNIHRKNNWEVRARIRKKSANISHNTTDIMVIVHMAFIFSWHFGTWKKDKYWTHFRTPCGFPMVLSPSPSTDTFIVSLIQLLTVYKHMFTGRYLNDYDLRLEWIKTLII